MRRQTVIRMFAVALFLKNNTHHTGSFHWCYLYGHFISLSGKDATFTARDGYTDDEGILCNFTAKQLHFIEQGITES